MATTRASKAPRVGTEGAKVRRWEGVLGQLRAKPRQAALIALVCLGLIGVAAYVVGVQLWGVYHWRQAKKAIDRVALTEAREHLERCARVWPTSAETEFLLARTCRRVGDFDAARTHLKKADELQWVREL